MRLQVGKKSQNRLDILLIPGWLKLEGAGTAQKVPVTRGEGKTVVSSEPPTNRCRNDYGFGK